MSPGELLLRADGGPGIGAGHLGRCLALAQAWLRAGGGVGLATRSIPSSWRRRYHEAGVQVHDADTGEVTPEQVDCVVIDGYRLGPEVGSGWRDRGAAIVRIDDHGTTDARGEADLIIDPNLGATTRPYSDVPPEHILLGERYALVRNEIVQRRATLRRRHPGLVRRLLVSVGGDPAAAGAQWFDSVLADWPGEAVLLQGKDDVGALMVKADLAFAAAGTTTWELACLGVPLAIAPIAENQRPVAAALQRHGGAVVVGDPTHDAPEVAAGLLLSLATDQHRRSALSEAASALIDGRGADRVVAAVRGATMRVRDAAPADRDRLLTWVNDPVTRSSAFSTDAVTPAEHDAWFARKLADPSCRIYIVEDSQVGPLGQVRFDREGDEATIDLSVAATHRGEGRGPAVLDAAVRRYFSDEDTEAVVGLVKAENAASIRTFDLAAFVGPVQYRRNGVTTLRYVRRRHGRRT